MKLTNEQIERLIIIYKDGIPKLNPIWEEMKKKKFPVSFRYWLKITFDKLVEKFTKFEEARQEIGAQHAIKNKDGEPVVKDNKMTVEDPVKFQEDFQELLKIEALEIGKIKVNFQQWDSNPKLDVLSFDEMDLLLGIIEEA